LSYWDILKIRFKSNSAILTLTRIVGENCKLLFRTKAAIIAKSCKWWKIQKKLCTPKWHWRRADKLSRAARRSSSILWPKPSCTRGYILA